MRKSIIYPAAAFAAIVVLAVVSSHADVDFEGTLLVYAVLQIAALRGELADR